MNPLARRLIALEHCVSHRRPNGLMNNGNAKSRIRPLDRTDLLPAPHHLNLLARPEPFSGRRIIGVQIEDT